MSDAIEAARRLLKQAKANAVTGCLIDDDIELVCSALLSAVEGKGRETCDAGAPPILTSDAIDGIVHLVVRDVAELPDRTSPPDQEHMMLVAGDELEDIVRHALQAFLAYAPALASPSTEGWLPMASAPVTEPMKHVRVMCWSPQLGVCVGDLHRWKDSPATINVACYHGDAVANWGVTHWQPLLSPPTPEQEGHADGLPEPKASTS